MTKRTGKGPTYTSGRIKKRYSPCA